MAAYINTLRDLIDYVEPLLGTTGSRSLAERVAVQLASYDH